MKRVKGQLVFVAVFFLALNVFAGCASHSKTVTTETTTTPAAQTVVVEKESTKTSGSKDYGILGGAFHVVGEVLAFPFEVVAGLFRFIF